MVKFKKPLTRMRGLGIPLISHEMYEMIMKEPIHGSYIKPMDVVRFIDERSQQMKGQHVLY